MIPTAVRVPGPWFKRPRDGVVFKVLPQYTDTIRRLLADGWVPLADYQEPPAPGSLEAEALAFLHQPNEPSEPADPVLLADQRAAEAAVAEDQAKRLKARNDNARAWVSKKA